MRRTIKVYKTCGNCEGTGLAKAIDYLRNIEYDVTCEGCYGKGKTIEKVYKDVNINELELPTGRD